MANNRLLFYFFGQVYNSISNLLVASVTSELPLNMIKKLMANEASMKQELLSKDIKSETMLEDLMMERRFQS